MNKFTAVAIAVIILCFGGLILWSTNQKRQESIDYNTYDSTKILEANNDNGNIADHVRGKADSKVVVIEYADLSCPGCASMMPRMSKLYEEYGDGRRDSVKQGEIVDFTEDKELYHINMREGTLTKNFDYDEWAMYKYQFMENGLKLKLVFVDSKEEIITPLPTEVYQKIK